MALQTSIMNCRHFGIEDESSTGLFELSLHRRHEEVFGEKKGGGGASAYAYLSL